MPGATDIEDTTRRIMTGRVEGTDTVIEIQVDATGRLILSQSVELDGIGAIEIKDGLVDRRATVVIAAGGNALLVQDSGPAAGSTARATVILTGGNDTAFGASTPVARGVLIQNLPTNAGAITVRFDAGDATTGGFVVQVGDSITFALGDLADIRLAGAAADVVEVEGV